MIKPRKAVLEMEAYAPPTSGRFGYLRLDFNENTAGCSPGVLSVLKNIKPWMLASYPEYSKLRKKIAVYCGVDASEVLPANGTDEAIKTVIEIFIERNADEIIIPVPTYAMFKFYAQLNQAVIKEIKYDDDLSFPVSSVFESINKKTKIIILVNPNNPTGTAIGENDIIKIIKKAKNCSALVVIDEAYYQFYGRTAIPLIKKYNNLIIIQTFSKAFGLAGLRCGYIISNKNNIKIIQKALSPYSVNIAAAICACAALNDIEYVNNYAEEVKKSRTLLCQALDGLGIKYYKSDANFILLKIGSKTSEFCAGLRKKGILIRNRDNDNLLRGCVRITLGTMRQTKLLIKKITEVKNEGF